MKITLSFIIAFILGFLTRSLARPRGDGIFYTVCDGYNCEVRAHMKWYGKDATLFRGPPFAIQLDEKEKVIQPSANNVAFSLSHLPGYGAHWQQK